MKRIVSAVAIVAIMVGLSAPAWAFSNYIAKYMIVRGRVVEHVAVSAQELSFGLLWPGENHATATIDVLASPGLPYKIGLDAGSYYSPPSRKMRHATAPTISLPYFLFHDPGHTIEWGNLGLAGPGTLYPASPSPPPGGPPAHEGIGGVQSYTVRGVCEVTTLFPPGDYSDGVTVEVHF